MGPGAQPCRIPGGQHGAGARALPAEARGIQAIHPAIHVPGGWRPVLGQQQLSSPLAALAACSCSGAGNWAQGTVPGSAGQLKTRHWLIAFKNATSLQPCWMAEHSLELQGTAPPPSASCVSLECVYLGDPNPNLEAS